jgi:DNA-binding beta-propeller fold protein YncE
MPKSARAPWALRFLAVALSPLALHAQIPLQAWAPAPLGLAVTHDGKKAYVTFSHEDIVLVVDLPTLTVSDAIDVSAAGVMLSSGSAVLTPDDRKLYAANWGVGNVMSIDTGTRRVAKALPLRPLWGTQISCSRDGGLMYVPSENTGLYVVDVRDDSTRLISVPGVFFGSVAPLPANPRVLAVVGSLAAGPGLPQRAFFEFDLATETVRRSTFLPAEVMPANNNARRLLLSPDGSRAYFGWCGATDRGTGNFTIFDLIGFRVSSTTAVDNGVIDFAVNETTGKGYLLGFWSGGTSSSTLPVHEWDLAQNRLSRDIVLSPSSAPNAIALDPAVPGAFLMTEGDHNYLARIEIAAGKVVGSLSFNRALLMPRGIVRDEDAGYVFLQSGTAAYRLDLRTGDDAGPILLPAQSRAVGFHGGLLYAKMSGNSVAKIDPLDSSVVGTFDLGTSLNTIFLNFSGTKMAAVDYETGMIGKRLLLFDGDPPRLVRSIDLPRLSTSHKAIFSPDGSKIYISYGQMMGSTTIEVFDANSGDLLKRLLIPEAQLRNGNSGFSQGVFDESRRILYLCGFESVYKIGMDSNELLGTIDLIDAYEARGGKGWTPTGLCGIALSRSRDRLFIEAGDSHTVYTYDLFRSAWLDKFVNVQGYFPVDAVGSADGRYLYSVNQKSDSVTMVDLDALAVRRIIDLSALKVVQPPLGVTVRRVFSRSLSQAGEAIDILSWTGNSKNSSSAGFRIYELNGSVRALIGDLPLKSLTYTRRAAPKNRACIYLVLEVDADGTEGVPAKITVK